MSNKKAVTNTSSSSSAPASKKRKLTEVKYYAVRAGHRPGVYTNWKECESNITGFKGASFKSFPTLSDANLFVAGKTPVSMVSAPASAPDKFYGVAKGHHPGVYTDWGEAQEQIKGWKGPRYKKFMTRKEAEEFVKSGGGTVTVGRPRKVGAVAAPEEEEQEEEAEGEDEEDEVVSLKPPPAKKVKGMKGTDLKLVDRATRAKKEDNRQPGKEMKSMNENGAVEDDGKGPMKIYTDGSSLGNGKDGAAAGIGVFFGNNDPRNISTSLPGQPQTNQRAELFAILRALEVAPRNRDVHIHTDSKYAINCMTLWYKNWERNGWRTTLGAEVLNQDLLRRILGLMRERREVRGAGKGGAGSETVFVWVKGHMGDRGNEEADRLAVAGARMG